MKQRVIFASVLVIAIMLFGLVKINCKSGGSSVFGASGDSPLKSSSEAAKAFEIQKTFRDIYSLYEDRVVFISTEQTVRMRPNPFLDDPFFRQFFGVPNQQRQMQRKRTGLGTGFVLSEDGYICTNHHVIAGVDKVTVKVGGNSYVAQIVGYDQQTDLALLKVNARLKPVFIGNSDEVKVGDWAIAIGNPFGLDKTFTVGVVSATARRDVDMMGGSQSHIQTDASINPGNSGGPLINIRGEVVGINRMIYSQSGGYMGIGFAIPVNTAKAVLEQLKKHRKIKRGFIGVQVGPVTGEVAASLGLNTVEGALVGDVVEGSPAARGGVQPGDVVMSVNGERIKSYQGLIDAVGAAPVGSTIKMTVWRQKSTVNLFITVVERT